MDRRSPRDGYPEIGRDEGYHVLADERGRAAVRELSDVRPDTVTESDLTDAVTHQVYGERNVPWEDRKNIKNSLHNTYLGRLQEMGAADYDRPAGDVTPEPGVVVLRRHLDYADRIVDEELDMDTLFTALKEPRRRHTLRYLRDVKDPASVSDIAGTVTDIESDGPAFHRKSVHTTLQQNHIPRLDEAGIVDFDPPGGPVTGRTVACLDPFLADSPDPDPADEYLDPLAGRHPMYRLAGQIIDRWL
ncbi:MAG: hypothetical protein ABEK12_02495 [Candidatus Nanohaloarchaea archaeon]